MGFFGTMGKILKGEPVFEAQNKNQGAPQMTNQPQPAMPGNNGPKVIPQVYIDQVECNEPGANMEVDIFVKNYSQVRVEVDRLELFGRSQELDRDLEPGQEYKFRVYSGPRMRGTGDNQCRLHYKTDAAGSAGDYFVSHHYIEFKQEADGTYSINRIIFRPPVQDV